VFLSLSCDLWPYCKMISALESDTGTFRQEPRISNDQLCHPKGCTMRLHEAACIDFRAMHYSDCRFKDHGGANDDEG
jgi:hypothetical protein